MSSSIVNFLITDPNNASNLISDPRVFDYRIGAAEQAFFDGLMESLLADLKQYKQSGTRELAWHINHILGTLNTWSKMKVSTDSGVVTTPIGALQNPSTTVSITPTTTMSSEMANAVDTIFRTMRSAGWDPISQYVPSYNDFIAATLSGNAKIAIDAIEKIVTDMDPSWNNTIYPISTWIAQGIQAAQNALLVADSSGVIDTSNTSLQQLLMVEYVSNGNKLLYDQMDALSTAINSNQEALSYLNSLQSLMNQKSPEQFVLALGNLTSSSLTDQNYTAFEKESFNNTLATTSKFTQSTLANYVYALNLSNSNIDNFTEKSTVATTIASLGTVNINGSSQYIQAVIDANLNDTPPVNDCKLSNFSYYHNTSDSDISKLAQSYMENKNKLYDALNGFTTNKAAYTALINSSTTTGSQYITLLNNLKVNLTTIKNCIQLLILGEPNVSWGLDGLYDPYIRGLISASDLLQFDTITNKYDTIVKPNLLIVQAQTTSDITAIDKALAEVASASAGTGTAAGAFVDIENTTNLFNFELDRIKSNLGHIIDNINLQTGSSGTALASSLNTVLNDFKNITSIETWVKDFDKTQNNQGNYQTNLNNAVVASQALNDAKREELQRSMFIFEEFYKSAMALLSRLTQLIEKMATSITR